ncbi:MAG: NADH-quinone oxidoreductase subunit B family protein [Planctomycetota bacterium]|jgi:coenzyme F420-reducing hydrogenase gamma subunit
MSKPRVAIFDFACCEGCQLQIVNLEEEILNLIDLVDVVEWREAMSEQSHEYDIAIIEGSITRPEDAQKLEVIRSRAKILIALGACATIGGVNKMKNNFDLNEVRECVYGKDAQMPHLNTEMTKAVDEVVEVDFKIHGCPIEGSEFAQIIRSLLVAMNTMRSAWGRSPEPVAALLVPPPDGAALAAAARLTTRMSKPPRRSWRSTT